MSKTNLKKCNFGKEKSEKGSGQQVGPGGQQARPGGQHGPNDKV